MLKDEKEFQLHVRPRLKLLCTETRAFGRDVWFKNFEENFFKNVTVTLLIYSIQKILRDFFSFSGSFVHKCTLVTRDNSTLRIGQVKFFNYHNNV